MHDNQMLNMPEEKKDKLAGAMHNVDENRIVSPSDETMDRAFRAAILGILFLPLQLYSLWLLLSTARARDPLSPAQWRKFVLTVVLNAPIMFVTGFLLWSMLFE